MLWTKIIGNAKKLGKMFGDLRDAADESLKDSLEILGEYVVAETKSAMVNQTPKWKPLSARHSNYKAIKGYDSRIYLMTKSLYNSINYEVIDSKKLGDKGFGKGYELKVGFPRTPHPLTGRRLDKIAERMEKGDRSKRLPPRPLISYATPIAQKKFNKNKKNKPLSIFTRKSGRIISSFRGSNK